MAWVKSSPALLRMARLLVLYNEDAQPFIQRPNEVLPTQAATKVPDKAADKVSPVAATSLPTVLSYLA